jgi:hypothetical protein
VQVQGAFSGGECHICPLSFSFPGLPEWQFSTEAFFVEQPLPYCLLSLAELLRNFELAISSFSKDSPWGCILLTNLKAQGHRGTRRS